VLKYLVFISQICTSNSLPNQSYFTAGYCVVVDPSWFVLWKPNYHVSSKIVSDGEILSWGLSILVLVKCRLNNLYSLSSVLSTKPEWICHHPLRGLLAVDGINSNYCARANIWHVLKVLYYNAMLRNTQRHCPTIPMIKLLRGQEELGSMRWQESLTGIAVFIVSESAKW
jgi:hypothetical protein